MGTIYNKKMLAELYGVCPATFEKMIEDIKSEIGWKKYKQVFTPKQSARIIEYLGAPFILKNDESDSK